MQLLWSFKYVLILKLEQVASHDWDGSRHWVLFWASESRDNVPCKYKLYIIFWLIAQLYIFPARYNSSCFFEILLQNLKYILLMFSSCTAYRHKFFILNPRKILAIFHYMKIFNALDHRHLTVYFFLLM